MSAKALVLSVLLLILGVSFRPASAAIKLNVTKSVASKWDPSFQSPDEKCAVDLPGICSPTKLTVPPRTLWYWCGFASTHRSIYNVSALSSKDKLSTFVLRKRELEHCVLRNISLAPTCIQIADSLCDRKQNCSVRLFGLSFATETCLVIANSGSTNVTATVQYNNFYDSARYYGTVCSILWIVFGGLWIIGFMGRQIYIQSISPPSEYFTKAYDRTPVSPLVNIELQHQQAAHTSDKPGGLLGLLRLPGWTKKSQD